MTDLANWQDWKRGQTDCERRRVSYRNPTVYVAIIHTTQEVAQKPYC